MAYAIDTKVPVDKTRLDIERTVAKYGAKSFAYWARDDGATIVFEANDRRVRFDMKMPPLGKGGSDQARRSRWRALLLCIKAKLESVEAGIETFEEAFLAHVVTPDGRTVGEAIQPQIASAYNGRELKPLRLALPPPRTG
jgi:hypothetical protein